VQVVDDLEEGPEEEQMVCLRCQLPIASRLMDLPIPVRAGLRGTLTGPHCPGGQ
jgi:hypothetical protein